ncbi:MAG: dihydropyrimidinase [Chloroflexi bacterium]|nr:dihydropyrimidinase [Chloroflexota bacterium]
MAETFDVLIRGGMVVNGSGMQRADVGIRGEKLAAVAANLEPKAAKKVVDATGHYVLPGAVDVHVHPVYLDNIHDTSISGAFGGTTTMIHFAYARPGQGLVEMVKKFRDDGLANSVTDFGLHGGIFEASEQLKELPEVFKLGVTSFKAFMTYAKLKWMTDDYWLMALSDMLGQLGGLLMVHAENGLATDYLEDKYNGMGMSALEVFTRTRPDMLEAEAVNRSIAIAKVGGCPLYIPHLSTVKALEPIRRWRAAGQVVYGESCPQYLTHTEAILGKVGPQAKIGPPIRTAEDREGLWQGIMDGTIDTVASDHAPKPKEINDDFFNAPYGSPQAETVLTLTYDGGVNTGRISVPRLVQLVSETPAKIFGYYPRKGAIAVGSDADVVLYNPTERFTISQSNQHSKSNYTLYEGHEVLGRPVWVMQRGHVVVEDGQLRVQGGQAQFLPTQVATKGL